MYNPQYCSPLNDGIQGVSCMDKDLLLEIAKSLNNLKTKQKKKDIKLINCSGTPEEIHRCIGENIKKISSCSSEPCWSTIRNLMKELGPKKKKFSNMFRPMMPQKWLKDYNTWLNTNDIDKVMGQYDKAHPDFFYGGALPIDFQLKEKDKCVVSDLCNFNLQDHIDNKINNIGIVFNTDPHDKEGQHWISLFINLSGKTLQDKPGIFYFDSYGHKPPSQVKDFIDSTIEQGKECGIDFAYLFNNKKYQKGRSQCGLYSIDFILQLLDNVSFNEYITSKANDERIDKLRSVYFINTKGKNK